MIDIIAATAKLGYSCLISLVSALIGLIFVSAILFLPFLGAGALWKLACIILGLHFDWLVPIAFVICAECLIATAEGGE